MSLESTIKARSEVHQRIVDHFALDDKVKALNIIMHYLSIDELNEIAKFFDEREGDVDRQIRLEHIANG